MEKVSTMEGNLSLSVVGQVKRQSCRKAIPSIHRNLVCNVSFRCNIIHLAECILFLLLLYKNVNGIVDLEIINQQWQT